MCERVSNYTKTVIVPAEKLPMYLKSPLLKSEAFLSTENDTGLHEVVSESKSITDTKPVHMGVAILHYSKLMMLKFVDFLRDYLIEGSYALVYTGKI